MVDQHADDCSRAPAHAEREGKYFIHVSLLRTVADSRCTVENDYNHESDS